MLSAIVLAGGKSTRMGSPKALLPFAGRPLIAHLAERMLRLTDDVVVVTNEAERYHFLQNVRFQADLFPGQGPLAGVQAGLQQIRHEQAWVLGCDLPFVSVDILHRIGKIACEKQADAVIPYDETREYPVMAVYSKRTQQIAYELLRRRENRMRGFISVLTDRGFQIHRVSTEQFRDVDHRLLSFFNMNTPDDYRMALSLWDTFANGL
ncbi:molybdenum cofactor guanylyltransferase [Collibacillus ludicampi]|nr:molybdenum cofactor guanylyltransferase [Collibacillus ludicampi]